MATERTQMGFSITSKTFWGPQYIENSKKDGLTEEITIGRYYKDGSTKGEFTISWNKFPMHIVPSIVAYDDSWKVLFSNVKLCKLLSSLDDKNIAPEIFIKELKKIGCKDFTKYKTL